MCSYIIQTQQCKTQGTRPYTCIGSKCTKRCLSSLQCQTRGGLLSIPTSICYFSDCGMNEVFNTQKQQCNCLNGFQRKAPKAPCHKIVQKCNGNGIKQSNGSCVCPTGYITQNNFCHNCSFANGQVPDFVKQQCACFQPTFYKAQNGTCVKSNCPGVLHYNLTLKTCMCKQGFIEVNNFYCQLKCGQKAYISNGLCRCVLNDLTYIPSRKQCVKLLTSCSTSFQQVDKEKNQCVCINGYQRNVFTKICQKKCGVNQFVLNNQCLCKNGYQRKVLNGPCTVVGKDCTKLSNEVLDVNSNQCICRNEFIRNNQGECIEQIKTSNRFSEIALCGSNQQYSSLLKSCTCKSGYMRSSTSNICQLIPSPPSQITLCPSNSKLVNNKCVCDLGYISQGQLCVSVCGLNQQFNSKTMLCDCIQGFGLVNKICTKCPANTLVNNNNVKNQCYCQFGLKWNSQNNVCQIICQLNALTKDYILYNGEKVVICVCQNGYEENNKNQCVKKQDPVCPICPTCPAQKICPTCPAQKICPTCPTCQTCPPATICPTCPVQKICPTCPPQLTNTISCPSKSTWDSKKYRCVCSNTLQNLINGVCTTCPLNQIWSQGEYKCICPVGFNIISNSCVKCPVNSKYSVDRCVCENGFYDQNPLNLLSTSCKFCHSSCKTCSGSLNTQCLSCKNPQDIFSNNKCTATSSPCPRGSYLNSSSSVCLPCGPYCKQCTNQITCTSCVDGFNIQDLDLFGTKASFCVEICGDGKRFQYECDDGNNNNGDGCSDSCMIQLGYTCLGGNITSPSTCMKDNLVPVRRSQFKLTIPIRLAQQMVQVAKFQYLPSNISMNFCTQCKDLLLITMLSYTTYPIITVDYIPSSLYSFTIRFKFNGIFTVPDFSYTVQINPKYNKYFTSEDMKQVQVTNVYAVNYAMKDDAGQLDGVN